MKLRSILLNGINRLQAYGIEEARLDAELLLSATCGVERAHLLAHLDEHIDDESAQAFVEWIERRTQHEPVAYILNHKEFFGLNLYVDARVLIPRPETELLVEQALQWLGGRGQGSGARGQRVEGEDLEDELSGVKLLDLGTGSGAVALAIASHFRHLESSSQYPAVSSQYPTPVPRPPFPTPDPRLPSPTPDPRLPSPIPLSITAADVSSDALDVARMNAARLGLAERISFVQSDLFAAIPARFDLIVANLPYIARDEWDELAPDIALYEPHLALRGGDDGLTVFGRFFAQAPTHLAPDGAILLEIGWQQAQTVSALARAAFPDAKIGILKDDAGLDRIVVVQTS